METVYSWSSNFLVNVFEDNRVNFESANLILLVEMYRTLAIIRRTYIELANRPASPTILLVLQVVQNTDSQKGIQTN